jgi:hypothetical protein
MVQWCGHTIGRRLVVALAYYLIPLAFFRCARLCLTVSPTSSASPSARLSFVSPSANEMSLRTLILAATAGLAAADDTTVTLNNGVVMPRLSLGTCCGSSPDAGLESWIKAGGIGVRADVLARRLALLNVVLTSLGLVVVNGLVSAH